MIRVENVSKIYHLDEVQVAAVQGVSLTVNRGEFLALAGPSGSGETTLLNLIGCIEFPSSGKITFDAQDVTLLHPDQRALLRSERLGFVFQNINLLPVLTAQENVEYPLTLGSCPVSERRERALSALRDVGLERFARHK